MQRPVRGLGGPAAGAAPGGHLNLPWLPLCVSCRSAARRPRALPPRRRSRGRPVGLVLPCRSTIP